MGDAEQLESAGKLSRGGRCGFGDGKEVGDTAGDRASRLRLSVAGDSPITDTQSPIRKSSEEAEGNILPPPRTMDPTPAPTPAVEETVDSDGKGVMGNGALPFAPRKTFSLDLRQRSGDDDDDKMADLFPRRAFSLEDSLVVSVTCPSTSSNLLRQRDSRKVVVAAAAGSGSDGGGGAAMWRVEKETEKKKTTTTWTRDDDEGEGEDEEEKEEAATVTRRRREPLAADDGIPELIEAFLDDGEVPTSEEEDDDDVHDAVAAAAAVEAKAAATSSSLGGFFGGGGCAAEGRLEADEASQALKQQLQQSMTTPSPSSCSSSLPPGLSPSLQSTCDVSSWSLCHYHSLPQWMQDNEFILSCHRPPLPSFFACFKSIFRLHTETLNIWTHLLGCVAFVAMGAYFLALPREAVWLQEKLAFGAFFGGGAACFALSSAYHTLWCHSPAVGRLFSKLDYCGIALLIMGSFVPWLYYAFYCRGRLLLAYLALVAALGALAVLVSLWGRFGEPRFRPLRAGVFLAYGLSGVVPALHFAAAEGWRRAVAQASLHWLALMGALYVLGACVYALRVPERFFPGRCDLLFQSHQIFHVFVIAAALVHYHGLTEMAVYRLSFTDCASRALA